MFDENMAYKAVCRFNVESLEVGLENEMELEGPKWVAPDICSMRIGRIYQDKIVSGFDKDNEAGNTDMLNKIMNHGYYFKLDKLLPDDDSFNFIQCSDLYVLYDLTNHLRYEPTNLDIPSDSENPLQLIEVHLQDDNLKRYLYFALPMPSGDVRSNDELAKMIEGLMVSDADEGKNGLKMTIAGELIITFYDEIGASVMQEFHNFGEIKPLIKSIRTVKII